MVGWRGVVAVRRVLVSGVRFSSIGGRNMVISGGKTLVVEWRLGVGTMIVVFGGGVLGG